MHTVMFAVEGSGRFPMDMLRYDRCFPVREVEDSHQGLDRHPLEDDAPQRRVVLARDFSKITDARRWMPTAGRWSSFTWKVVAVGTPGIHTVDDVAACRVTRVF